MTVSSMPIWVPDVYVDTSITSSPPSSTTSTSASFGFTSNLTPVTYACRLDGGSWAACSSPKAYSGLATGSHTFQVAAIDSYDRVDPTPASYSWQITAPAGPATHFTVSGLTTPRTAGAAGTITVTALDASGNRATGYRGRVHFTSSDPKAVLPADFTFTATDAGRHSFSVTLKTAGSHAIRARDTVTASITGLESPIVVNPGAATTLSVLNLPSPITAGTSGSIIVRALDAYGNRATGYRGSVHFTSTDTKAVLPVDYAFTATDSGSHVFSVTLRTAGAQAIRARDKTTSTITGLQTQITVRPAAAATLTVSGLASPRTAGTVGTITVRAYDRYGNLATGYRETVHFTSTDTKATLPADHAFTASDNGVHAFSVTLRAKGSQAIRARDIVTATITGLQTGIVVQ